MSTPSQPPAAIPPDDPARTLWVASADAADARHLAVAGDTYTVLVGGRQTEGRYCLIDMHVPAGGGPPPHRHDFEEMFTLLEGEIEFSFRGETQTVRAPATVNIPANAPHAFTNRSGAPARLLCCCAPAGLEEFFAAVGDPVAGRTAPPPRLDAATLARRRARLAELAPRYRTELLPP